LAALCAPAFSEFCPALQYYFQFYFYCIIMGFGRAKRARILKHINKQNGALAGCPPPPPPISDTNVLGKTNGVQKKTSKITVWGEKKPELINIVRQGQIELTSVIFCE
jgi:hypothetical protein